MIEACKTLANNNQTAIKEVLNETFDKTLNEQLTAITEKNRKHFYDIEKVSERTKSSLSFLTTYIIGGFLLIVILLSVNLYLVYDYTSVGKKFLTNIDETLRGNAKYWWDEEKKQLYFKYIEK